MSFWRGGSLLDWLAAKNTFCPAGESPWTNSGWGQGKRYIDYVLACERLSVGGSCAITDCSARKSDHRLLQAEINLSAPIIEHAGHAAMMMGCDACAVQPRSKETKNKAG